MIEQGGLPGLYTQLTKEGISGLLRAYQERRSQRMARLRAEIEPVDTSENSQKASEVIGQIDQAREDYFQRRFEILRTYFPEVMEDAALALVGEHEIAPPWFTHSPLRFAEDMVDQIKMKYQVQWNRNRPEYPNEISPMTEVFYQCSEVLLEKANQGIEADLEDFPNSSYEDIMRVKLLSFAEQFASDVFKRHLESLSPEARRAFELTPKDIQELRDIAELSRWAQESGQDE